MDRGRWTGAERRPCGRYCCLRLACLGEERYKEPLCPDSLLGGLMSVWFLLIRGDKQLCSLLMKETMGVWRICVALS